MTTTSLASMLAVVAAVACGNKSPTAGATGAARDDLGGGALVFIGYADAPRQQALIDTKEPSDPPPPPDDTVKDPIQMFDVANRRLTTLTSARLLTMGTLGVIRGSTLVMTADDGLLAVDIKHGAKRFRLANPVRLGNDPSVYGPYYAVDRGGERLAHPCKIGDDTCVDFVRVDQPFLDSGDDLPPSGGAPKAIPSPFNSPDPAEIVQWTDDGRLLVSDGVFGAFSHGTYSDNKSTARLALVDPGGKAAPLIATVEAPGSAERLIFSGANELAWTERTRDDVVLVVATIDHPADRHRYDLGVGQDAFCIFVGRDAFACSVDTLEDFRLVSVTRADAKVHVLDPHMGLWISPMPSPDGHWIAYVVEDAQKRRHLRIAGIEGAPPVAPLPNDPPVRAVMAWLEAK